MKLRKRGFGAGVGGIMVFTVLSVLCVAVFAVLSMSSALADLRLSEKTAQMTTQYYEMDALGVRLLCTAEDLWPAGRLAPSEAQFLSALQPVIPDAIISVYNEVSGTGTVNFHISTPVGESRLFEIKAGLLPAADAETGSRWVIESWSLGAAYFEEVDVGIPIWIGN